MTALAKLPNLSADLLALIGSYGLARTDGVSEVERVHRWQQLIDGIKQYATDCVAASLSPAEVGGVEIVPGRIVGYLMRAQAVEFVTDGPLPEWLASQPNLRAVIATGETFKAIGREGEGHSAEWCAGWNAHLIASTPRAAEAVTVDKAMIERAVNACIQSKGRYSAYHAPETDDEWRAALTASLTPPSPGAAK